MRRLILLYFRLINFLIAILLALMVVLVFGNVVLRYAFNSGWSVSEEVARWLFVWITFLGAVLALAERSHLGTDILTRIMPRWAQKLCQVVGYVMMLYVTWLVFEGSLAQTEINWDVTAPTTGASVAVFYASGVVFAVSAALILLRELVRALVGAPDVSLMHTLTNPKADQTQG